MHVKNITFLAKYLAVVYQILQYSSSKKVWQDLNGVWQMGLDLSMPLKKILISYHAVYVFIYLGNTV